MDVGRPERITQQRVVQLIHEQLEYDYLGKGHHCKPEGNIQVDLLQKFLTRQGYSEALSQKAINTLTRAATNQVKSLYDLNKEVYSLLRYGVKEKVDNGDHTETVWLINWKEPSDNDFAIAEEVTIPGKNDKRPDILLYVNGIAIGVLELKRSTVSVSEGIRQNLARFHCI